MTRTLTALLALGSIAFFSGTALADGGQGGYYGDHPMMGGNWFMGPLMMVAMVIIVVVAIVIILKAFGLGGNATTSSNTQDRALTILNERFAKGEIDKAEYEERKNTLGA